MNSENKSPVEFRFIVRTENITKLRKMRDDELRHNRPGGRELPPPPVLPPFGPLEKIRGRLEAFHSEFFSEYFDALAYRTSTLPNVSAGQMESAAALACAEGIPGGVALFSRDSDAENTSAEYVQGIINGKPFSGWVGLTRLQAGDEVEMAVEWQHDHYQVYAITLPAERIISICPQCDMGHIAHGWFRLKCMFITTTILVSIFIFFMVINSISEGGWPGINAFIVKYYMASAFMSVMALGVSILMSFSAHKAIAPTRCKLAEEIFRLFDMKNVASLDLNKVTRERERELKKTGEWYPPRGKRRPLCPSSKFSCSSEWWFYY